ncbi:MAG: pesticidal protein Cry15Aa [Chloroflexi bacterium]|nr:pesticidal protein Cry15Aa [Chloroflexota bacterium]MBU1751304.1 pesticidal protein Cry15Aa [Chloroflexota bacterium]
MPIIKRYPNRKLYDTERKQYITLEEIAGLIRRGEEIQVVDHATGEDLTSLTLTQIIMEQEKKRSGFLPQAVLTGLIQSGGDTLGALRHTLAAPLDLLRQVDDEIERRIRNLINRGELAEEEGIRLRDKLLAPSRRQPSEQDLERVLSERGVPTQNDFQQMVKQLEVLATKLESVSEHTKSDKRL